MEELSDLYHLLAACNKTSSYLNKITTANFCISLLIKSVCYHFGFIFPNNSCKPKHRDFLLRPLFTNVNLVQINSILVHI